MPKGDVRLLEFAEAVRDRIASQVDYLGTSGRVKLVDPDDPEDPFELRKGLGTAPYGVRISYSPTPVTPQPGFGNTIEFGFALTVSILYRVVGNTSSRMDDNNGMDITKVLKDVVSALQGERLGILNAGGLECSPAGWVAGADSLQILQFAVSGRSRESRS